MTTSRRRSRLLRAGALALAGVMLLAGCAIPLPDVDADAAPSGPQPALDQTRLDRVIASITDTLATADADLDPDLLAERVNGPALRTREAEYRLAEATADSDDPTALQTVTLDPQQIVMSNSETWPHRVFLVTTIADGMNTPLLVGLEQDSPREQYEMFSWVRLFPEITTPATTVPAEGSPEVAPDAEGLVLSPEDAIAAYADVLEKDDDSKSADAFTSENDYFRDAVVADRDGIEDGLEEGSAYSETFDVRNFEPVSLQTADGGAIVVGALRSDQVYELTDPDAELTVSTPEVVALYGNDSSIEVEDALTVTYWITVALYVPPASDGATIQVLGAERVLDAVEDTSTDE